MISLCCDYRVMASGNFRIGLNESQIGIVAPFWFVDLYCRTIGERHSERLLQLGAMISPEEALEIGMVDEVAEADRVVDAAVEALKPFLTVPAVVRRRP